MPETIELLKEIKEILVKKNEPKKNEIKMLYVKDVARILGINQNKANELWNRIDFPGIQIGQKKVEQEALKKWIQERREEI